MFQQAQIANIVEELKVFPDPWEGALSLLEDGYQHWHIAAALEQLLAGNVSRSEIKKQLEIKFNQYLEDQAQEFRIKESIKAGRGFAQMVARDRLFQKDFEKIAQKVFANKIQVTPYVSHKICDDDPRILNLMLSDLHFQSLLDPREVPVAYGAIEESRRLGYILDQAVNYKRQYRDQTTLYLHVLGDLMQGQLHDARDGAPQAEQVCATIWYMTQAVGYLSSLFPKVVVFWVPGNHGRNVARHPGRAIHQKWDAIETQIGYAVKMATQHLSNIEFNLFYTPYYTFKAFGERGFMTHGDTVFDVGNVTNTISVAHISSKIHQINDEFRLSGEQPCTLFGMGHLHVGHHLELPSGEALFINGALVPADPYAVSIGRLRSKNGQWLWESVPGHLVGDTRYCHVDSKIDKDPYYNKIIKPFGGIDA